MLSKNNNFINFVNFEIKNNHKKRYLGKKAFKFFIIFFTGLILSILPLISKFKTLFSVSSDFYSIKHFIDDEQKKYFERHKQILKKEERLLGKYRKLKLLKKTPKKLLEKISEQLPENARLEEFNFNYKSFLTLKGKTKDYNSIKILLSNLENDPFIPPLILNSSKYISKENEYEFIISLRL